MNLPSWIASKRAVEDLSRINPQPPTELMKFIYAYQPQAADARDFREQLRRVVFEARRKP